jgi:glycosyltransferase involved in cell wall biosynthesis
MVYFSVIIPLYNKENYIENALKSILDQSFLDYEILIINDGSTDNSISNINHLQSDKITVIHHKKNKGLSAARNTGIRNAKGTYVTFLDADDLWKPDFLITIHTLIKQFPQAGIFATNYEELYKDRIVSPKNGTSHLVRNESCIIDFFKYNLQQGIYNHGSVCFHKKVYEKAGYYDENIDFSEDIDFNIRANSQFSLAFCNKVGMSYNMQSENQLTTSSILHKRIPNFSNYDHLAEGNLSIKKYLNFEKYVLAKHLKVDKNNHHYQNISTQIDLRSLNWKQIILLKLPVFLLKSIQKIKKILVRRGLKLTTY